MRETLLKTAGQGKTREEKLNFLREQLHHLILQETDRRGGFEYLSFIGGTALRLLYGLDRFSEDLDFSLSTRTEKKPDLGDLITLIQKSLEAFGIDCEVASLKTEKNVQSCFLRFSNLLYDLDSSFRKGQKLAIKFEIDRNPPHGARETVTPVTGIYLYNVRHFEPSSLFAGKLHAILCRKYTKGRDLYDFLWYVGRRTPVNVLLLENAVEQTEGSKVRYSGETLKESLVERFKKVDFKEALRDLEPFLLDPRALSLLTLESFLGAVDKLTV